MESVSTPCAMGACCAASLRIVMSIVITHSNRGAKMNIACALRDRAASTPGHPVILFDGAARGCGELDARSSQLAHAMAARGIAAGDRVALFLPNIPEFAVVYYAAQRLGAIPVSISSAFRTAEVAYLLQDSGAKLVFASADLIGFV